MILDSLWLISIDSSYILHIASGDVLGWFRKITNNNNKSLLLCLPLVSREVYFTPACSSVGGLGDSKCFLSMTKYQTKPRGNMAAMINTVTLGDIQAHVVMATRQEY